MEIDKKILELFKDENSTNYAFSLLVKTYQERIYLHIRRMVISHDDADDITQNTFIKAWKGLSNFKGDSQLSTWLYRIATNESITFLNKKKKLLFLPIVDVEKQLSHQIDNGQHFTGDEIQIKLQKAILTLPEKQRLVFNMKYFDDLKYDEIAEVLDTSVGALKASFHHATKKIEEFLKTD